MERDPESGGSRDQDRARVENVGVDEENPALDDTDPLPGEGMAVDDV